VAAEEFEFQESDTAPVLAALARSGGGWLNLQPGMRDDDVPEPRTLFGTLFTARGPQVPIATWVPAEDSAGIQHAAGPKAAARLAEAGVPVPDGWRVVQDHPKRGLVMRVPQGTPDADVITWLLAAARELCGVPLTGDWLASVYRG
jgi:hypothetical protein